MMPIPKIILNQLKCCLFDDGHIVYEPIILRCGANACKKCIIDSYDTTLKCFGCKNNHEKIDFLNKPINKLVNSVIEVYSNDIIQYLSKLVRIKKDGGVNKYRERLRSNFKNISTKALNRANPVNTKCSICYHQLNTVVGLKIHSSRMHKNLS
jgi:hypothetical protein